MPTIICKCCKAEFTYVAGFAMGRPRVYCDKCSLGSRGCNGIGECKVCGKSFVRKGETTVHCPEHRIKRDGLTVKTGYCTKKGCGKPFTFNPRGGHHRKRCDLHRRRNPALENLEPIPMKQLKPGCSSCFYGMASPHAASGYLCTAGLFRQCNPEIVGRHYKAREEKVG